MGIFSKRVNKQGGIAGMITGISFTSAYIIYYQFLNDSGTPLLFGISPEGIGVIGMLLNFIVAFVVSAFTPAPPEDVQRMVRRIHNPRGAGDASH
jgi:cation/acetate symporter